MSEWIPATGERLVFIGNGPLPRGTKGVVSGGPVGEAPDSGRWRVDHETPAGTASWGDWTLQQLRALWRPIPTEPGQARRQPFFTGLPPKWSPQPVRRVFDPASFSVHINGAEQGIRLKDVSWTTSAGQDLDDAARMMSLARQPGETDDSFRIRVRSAAGQSFTAPTPLDHPVIRLNARFVDGGGDPYDPESLTVSVRGPSGSVRVRHYPAPVAQGADIVRERLGCFHCDYQPTEVGRHRVRWNTAVGAKESEFDVRDGGDITAVTMPIRNRQSAPRPVEPALDPEERKRLLTMLGEEVAGGLADLDESLDAVEGEDR